MSLRIAKPSEAPARGVESAELRHRQAVTVLREGNIQVGAESRRGVHADRDRPGCDRVVVVDASVAIAAVRRRGDRTCTPESFVLVPMSKSKLTPMRSKKLSLSVMKRTSIGHLQVLQSPQLLQEIGDLLVHFLGLPDHQAQVRFEGLRSSRGRRP